jgi:microcin C transport system permease protein
MIGSFALLTMLVKNSLLENLAADYVRTAMASGLTWRRAVLRHALRNSLIPLATSFGGNIGLLLTGSLLIERVFTIPGMGLLFFESITARDYPVVMGLTVISALLLLIGNLLSDLCVAAVDPRVRFQ